ncbi:hypothetical protein SeLEV6574_g03242 [Synchytrium endobioticum]|nr:hypothetical protein SeLEV6574_g03242 [Synchytrium endobioticum]
MALSITRKRIDQVFAGQLPLSKARYAPVIVLSCRVVSCSTAARFPRNATKPAAPLKLKQQTPSTRIWKREEGRPVSCILPHQSTNTMQPIVGTTSRSLARYTVAPIPINVRAALILEPDRAQSILSAYRNLAPSGPNQSDQPVERKPERRPREGFRRLSS